MRTTLDLTRELVEEAMELTHIKTKTELIKTALESLIQREKTQGLQEYFGKIDLDRFLSRSYFHRSIARESTDYGKS
ncbi:MAG: type II toxin-antitoxin system VapB family antitoxin [Spirochaeta sp.]|nr:type II toxin-antitoxin system VapB family antitoxin [Spirochaeta sp.]